MNKELYDFILNKKHHKFRRDFPEYENIAEQFAKEKLSPKERMTRRFELMAKLETPVILENEKICFLRTVKKIPDCFLKVNGRKSRKNTISTEYICQIFLRIMKKQYPSVFLKFKKLPMNMGKGLLMPYLI